MYSRALGTKYTLGLVLHMVGGKMPGGFNITSVATVMTDAFQKN